jgi:hypothetical protein
MARTATQIYNQNVNNLVSSALANGITITPAKWSQYNIMALMLWVCASAIAIFEQIFDTYTANLEIIASGAPPCTALWIQNFCLNTFQYNAGTPQVLQWDENPQSPTYQTAIYPAGAVANYKIITQCVVVPGVAGSTVVKVAQSGPSALTSLQLSALQSALLFNVVPGINITAQSANADKIFIGGIVTFSGMYSAVIQTAVTSAISAFLASIPTTGIISTNSTVGLMKLTDLIEAVKAVTGVIDFELINVNARPDGISFVPGSYNLVNGANWINNQWASGLLGAGYMTTETTAGYDINSSLTYNAI